MSDTVYVSYYDEISQPKAKAFMQACSDIIRQTTPKHLYFLFSSPGGNVDAGIAMYNYLRALPSQLTMHNIGSIDSIGNVVFLAAERRFAVPHSTFLFHGVTWNFPEAGTLSYGQLVETMSRFKGDESKMTSIITERTSLSEETLTEFLRQGESKDPEFALAAGVIEEVRHAKVPEGVPLVSLAFP